MAKQVFKSLEIKEITKPVLVEAPKFESPKTEEELKEGGEAYTGPTVSEIEDEIRQMRQQSEEELQKRRTEFEDELKEVKRDAENWAFEKVKEASDEYDNKIGEADAKAKEIIVEAESNARAIIQEAEERASKAEEDAYRKGYDDGRDEGFATGKEEVDRLVSRLNVILSSAINKRNEILEETEAQIIEIVITIARKVVKTISETQKRVVYDNITEALKRLKGRAEITIRVNTEDLQMTTKHKKEFIQMVEGIEQVRILEDNSVDKGGCIITTDFGSIDARISSQLSEIEAKIKEISPLKEEI